MASNPYFSSTYDEYKARQLKQRSGQDFLNDAGYKQSNPNIPNRPVQQQQQPQKADIMGNMTSVNGTASGLAGIAAGVTSQLGKANGEHGFSVDPYAGYTGSFNGLSSGGPLGAVTGGFSASASGFTKANNAIKGYNASNDIGGMQYDINGKPIYNSQGVNSAIGATKELKDAEMSGTSWWLGGKAGGVAGIDTTTLAATLRGTKRKARRKREETFNKIDSAQKSYNSQQQQFQQQQNQQEEYSKRLNNQNRINNLYKIPTSYQSMF